MSPAKISKRVSLKHRYVIGVLVGVRVCSFSMKILCKQSNVHPNIHGQCIYTSSCSTMYSESTRFKVWWGRQIRGRELPTHAIAAAAVVGPRFWLSPVDIAINFHAYLLFCRTSLIIKNKSIFNGVFEKQTLFGRASVWFVLFLGSFGLRQLALKLVALKCCVYCWVLYILFVFGFIFLFARLIGHTTACWQGIQ